MIPAAASIPDYVTVAISVLAVIISTIAATVSWLGYRIARRNELRALDATQPEISAWAGPLDEHPAWLQVHMTVQNKFAYELTIDSVSAFKPRFSRLLGDADIWDANVYAERVVAKELRSGGQAVLSLDITLPHAGKSGNSLIAGSSDTARLTFAVTAKQTMFTKSIYVRVSLSARKNDVRRSQRIVRTVKIA